MGRLALLVLLFILIIAGAIALVVMPGKTPVPTTTSNPAQASLDDMITVTSPLPQGIVASPLTVTGVARGNWFFEAQAPAKLEDAHGTVIAQGPVQAQGDWMTTNYVPFSVTFTFSEPATPTGIIVLQNDNPSGNPATQEELDIPVRFN